MNKGSDRRGGQRAGQSRLSQCSGAAGVLAEGRREEGADVDPRCAEPPGRDHVARTVVGMLGVGVAPGLRVPLDATIGQVHDPVLGHPGTRVEPRLDEAVLAQGGARHLDH